ncbi:MAG: FAD-dependent oxidoreductase [Candidatus Uhrbacteria bacterium]
MKIIIIGGGIAGTTCAEELRKLAPTAEITLVTEEQTPLYSRVLLPHLIKGLVPREKIFLKTDNWYAEQKIWRTEARAENIDFKNSFVATSDGRELPFDKLVIASGRYTRDVPDYRRGVAYLWTLEDADHLSQLLSEHGPTAEVGVYGGGLIACEFINIFKHFNLKTTVAFRGPYFWSRVLDKESGQLINQRLEKQGIKVVPQAQFKELGGEKELTSFVTDRGEFASQILGVGIGLEPDISWLADSGLQLGKGIVVNEKTETNLPNVYAIGDVAEVFDATSGRNRIMGTWTAAQAQGRIAAQNIVGQKNVFDQVTTSSMKLLDLDVIFLGDTDRGWADEIIVEGSAAEGSVVQIFFKNKKAIGATLVNANSQRQRVVEMIKVLPLP